jgi:hypothetical protein
MDPRDIERMYRNRASLPPAQRAEVERQHQEMVDRSNEGFRNGGRPQPRRQQAPTPPSADPVPTRGPAALGPVNAPYPPHRDIAMGGTLISPRDILPGMRVGDMDPARAARINGSRPAPRKAAGPSGVPPLNSYDPRADAAELVRLYGPETAHAMITAHLHAKGMTENDASNYAGYDIRSAARASSPADLSDGLAGAPQTPIEDAPSSRYGNYDQQVADSERHYGEQGRIIRGGLHSQTPIGGANNLPESEESLAIREKQAADNEARLKAIGQKYGPAAEKKAREADAQGVTDFAATRTPANQKRVDDRKRNEWDARNDDAAARSRLRGQDARQSEANKKARAGIEAARVRSGAPSEAERWNNYRAQMMLAGSNPHRNMVNAWGMMNDPNVNKAQRNSLRYMLPGGQLAAGVDAHQLQAAAELAQHAVTGALAGTAQGPLAQAQADMAGAQAQAERDKLRREDEDILGEKYAPEGYFGYDEFTVEEQQQMYDDLISQGYRPAEAQRAVDRQAHNRRATNRHRWNDQGA